MSNTDHTGPGIIPQTVLEQIHDDLATWANTPDSEWEIDYASYTIQTYLFMVEDNDRYDIEVERRITA